MLSRVADGLYWMSRYLERAERVARILDVTVQGMLDESPEAAEARWRRLSGFLDLELPEEGGVDAFEVARRLALDVDNPSSIVSCVSQARENARQVREQINSDMWEQLNRLYLQLRQTRLEDAWADQPHEVFRSSVQGSQLFQGITDSTMLHGEGWHFIQVGRHLERAVSTAALLDSHFQELGSWQARVVAVQDYLEWVALLRYCAAFEAYTKYYTADFRPDRIAELLLLNEQHPHSIRFAADMLERGLAEIADLTESRKSNRALRTAGRLRATLDFGQIEEILAEDLHGFLGQAVKQCEAIHEAIHERYIAYPVGSALA